MANQLYPSARERFATAQLDWTAGTVKALLIYQGYTFDSTDEFLIDIAPSYRGQAEIMTNRTATNGFCSADPTPFENILLTDDVNAVVFYVDTGDSSTSVLIGYADSLDGFPLDINSSGDFTLYPDIAFGGYFRL